MISIDEKKNFKTFNKWFNQVVEQVKPSVIVGIARGAIRLLQLQGIEQDYPSIPIISNEALPFIPDSGINSKRILLFDDSVIFGSTMSQIRDYLIKRNAIVFCSAFVIDRFNFFGEANRRYKNAKPSIYRDIPLRFKHRLWPNEIRRHHGILVSSILQMPNHYNLDFPTYSLIMPKYSKGDIPIIIDLLKKSEIYKDILDVSTAVSVAHDIYRYTGILMPFVWGIFSSRSFACRSFSKFRITFIPNHGEIKFTPLPQLMMEDGIKFEDMNFENKTLISFWEMLNPPYKVDDHFYPQALFRLLTSFVAIIIGKFTIKQSTIALQKKFSMNDIKIYQSDVQYVLGLENSKTLKKIFLQCDEYDLYPETVEDFRGQYFKNGIPINSHIYEGIVQKWKELPYLKPQLGETNYEFLGKIFLTLRAVTDSQECREKNPSYYRLEKCLSFEEILELLKKECDIDKITHEGLTIAMDMCVDNGQAVPKVIKQNSKWIRSFYSGENEDDQNLKQFKNSLCHAYKEFLDNKKYYLTPFDFHKLCTTLKNLFPHLPISTRFYTRGVCAYVGQSETELISWLTDNKYGPFKLATKDKKKIIQLNPKYKPVISSTWSRKDSRDFYDAFEYISKSFIKLSSNAKLLISTCRTHRHAYNAVAVEAHNWISNKDANFFDILSEIKHNLYMTNKISSKALISLYWCIIYISEARKKYNIFHREFGKLVDEIKKEFEKQGHAASRFWRFMIEEKGGMLDDSEDDEISYRFELLIPLIKQISRITAYTTRLLINLELTSEVELESKFKSENIPFQGDEFKWLNRNTLLTNAREYNADIKNKEIPGLSIVKTELPLDNLPVKMDDSNNEWFSEQLAIIEKCSTEIGDSLKKYCQRYEVVEGDFPFSPDDSRRVLEDGGVETTYDATYILTMDIIGSTDSIQTNKFKDVINSRIRSFNSPHLFFEMTGNDAFVVCSEDVNVLWDIANSVRIEGERFRKSVGRLDGTRKALSFGKVNITENDNGSFEIRDADTPHILPRAFSLLDGIDTSCEKNPELRNSLIIIDRLQKEQFKQLKNVDYNPEKLVTFKAKHFEGKCYIVDLRSIMKKTEEKF